MDINELMVSEPKNAFKKLTLPLIAFAVFDAFYSLIDLAWAGLLGHNAVAAVGVATPLFVLIGTFGSTIGQGTNSLMSKFLGIDEIKRKISEIDEKMLSALIGWIDFSSRKTKEEQNADPRANTAAVDHHIGHVALHGTRHLRSRQHL